MNSNFINANVKMFLDAGINVIPVDITTKRPKINWKEFQTSKNTYKLANKFVNFSPVVDGIAVITGQINGFECIDFDNKVEDKTKFYNIVNDFIHCIEHLAHKIYVEFTQNGGLHFIYKSSYIENNQKLAHIIENGTPKLIIETRGEGGYVIIAPTTNYTVGKYYNSEKIYIPDSFAVSLLDIEPLTPAEREEIINIARSYEEAIKYHNNNTYKIDGKIYNIVNDNNPFAEFNRKKEAMDLASSILVELGWEQFVVNKYGLYDYTRPNKSSGVSGGWILEGNTYFFRVFTTSTELEAKAYTPFSLIATLKFDNNYSATTKWLAEKKYINLEQGNKTIDNEYIRNMMIKEGFRQYVDGATTSLVRIKNNIVSLSNKNEIINQLCEADDRLINRVGKITDNLLSTLPIIRKEDFYNDEPDKSYFFFIDAIIEISKNQIKLIQNNTSEKLIWSENIINSYVGDIFVGDYQDFTNEIKKYFHYDSVLYDEQSQIYNGGEEKCKYIFPAFLKYVTCKHLGNKLYKIDNHKLQKLMSAIGYLLHNRYRTQGGKVIVFSDDKELANLRAEGRRGKSLLINILSKIRNTTKIAARHMEWNRFTFQDINIDSNICVFDDADATFQLKKLYNATSGDIKIEKKGEKPFELRNLKFAVTTNYINIDTDASTIDRIVNIQFSNYFSMNHRPIEQFGKNLIDDFDAFDWNITLNTLFYCIMYYLHNDLPMEKLIETENSKIFLLKHGFAEFPDIIEDLKELFDKGTFTYDDVFNLIQSYFSIDDEKAIKNRWNTKTIHNLIFSFAELFNYTLEKKRKIINYYSFNEQQNKTKKAVYYIVTNVKEKTTTKKTHTNTFF